VAIARALAQGAEILMLDEASAHLDIRHAVALYGARSRRSLRAKGPACLASCTISTWPAPTPRACS